MCLWYLLQKLLQLYFGQVVAYYYGVEKLVILNALGAILGTGILEFNSCSDHGLDLFWVQTCWLNFSVALVQSQATGPTSCQLGFLTSWAYLSYLLR